jgi:hypothetical protein
VARGRRGASGAARRERSRRAGIHGGAGDFHGFRARRWQGRAGEDTERLFFLPAGTQRILVHPNDKKAGPHGHVNDPKGQRLDADGNVVPQNSDQAHLKPIKSEE